MRNKVTPSIQLQLLDIVMNKIFRTSTKKLSQLSREIGDVAVQTIGYPSSAFRVSFVYQGERFGGGSAARFLVPIAPNVEDPLLVELFTEYFDLKKSTETLKGTIQHYLTHFLNLPPEEKYDKHFEEIFLNGMNVSDAFPGIDIAYIPLFNDGINQELLETQKKTYSKATEIIDYINAIDILEN